MLPSTQVFKDLVVIGEMSEYAEGYNSKYK